MPGLKQLKQFSSDILNLGDEVKIRAARGEKPVTIAPPKGISAADDSDDFIDGLPMLSEDDLSQAEAAAAEREREAHDFSDIIGESSSAGKKPAAAVSAAPKLPDVSDLLNPADGMDLSDADLSEFEEPEPVLPEEPEETPVEDLDLEALLQFTGDGTVEEDAAADDAEDEGTDDVPSTEDEEEPAQDVVSDEERAAEEERKDAFNKKLDSMLAMSEKEPAAAFDIDAEEKAFEDAASPIDMGDVLPPDIDDVQDSEAAPEAVPTVEESVAEPEESSAEPIEAGVTEATTEEAAAGAADSETDDFNLDDLLDDVDAMTDTGATPVSDDFSMDDIPEEPAVAEEAPAADDMNLDDLSFDDGDSNAATADASDDFSLPTFDDATDSGFDVSTDAADGSSLDSSVGEDADSFDFSGIDIDTPDTGASDMESSEADEPLERFDTSGMDMDGSDFELGSASGIEGDDEFAIPGFSDTVTANLNKKEPEPEPAATGADAENVAQKPKNTFTDAEYKRFLENLAQYPLNIRIALEDFVVKNEFTDDAVFEVLEKVLRKAPARQVASALEKLLDTSLPVPRDYEHRSAAEYEAYKKTLEFKLKNRIIPFAILGTIAVGLFLCISYLSINLIWHPFRAHTLYKAGYKNIQESLYPQSQEKFNEALMHRQVKKWFYRYADSYREHKQYERARVLYSEILKRFKHEKAAGLLWASMEANDLYNYEEAERILKREVLDYHINDPDGILQLGDLYLDWASDRDASKYALAKEQYDLLMELYGATKQATKYQSRQMRYYIRTDNLAEVLQYKQLFYPKTKDLESEDLIELSGYLLEKRYGNLRPSEENLRKNIEDVRDLLEAALKRDSSNPSALYNMGRYFVKTNNGSKAVPLFQGAISAFKDMRYRSRRDTYKYINTYRMLGEEYANEREYILAEQTYGQGIDLYEKEQSSSGFEGTEDVGKLYGDMGDLDYFISGNMDAALKNYTKAVDSNNDTSSVRYRIGYIHYISKNYKNALNSFIISREGSPQDSHVLLALANTLNLNDDNYAAQGYYEMLLNILDRERDLHGVMLPQVREDQADIVDIYMKAANNLGVTLYRIANMTGNSRMNAESIVQLQESVRAWDALTRNQETMVRLEGSNLAQQNIKYITAAVSDFEPGIYTAIPKTLKDEEGLE